MGFIYIILGINTLIIFLYKREWLFNKKPFVLLLVCNLLLFAIGYLAPVFSLNNSKMIVALKMPFISQMLFVCLTTVFKKVYKRNPEDTFWSMDIKQMKDGVFNFLFWIIAVVLPAILVFGRII